MKAVRQYIMNLLQTNLKNINTFISGYPLMPKVDWCPLVMVFSDSETVNWKATGTFASSLDLHILVGVDARQEMNSDNRGQANEDFLNDMAEQIKALLFKNAQIDDDTILAGILQIEYRNNLDAMVRMALIKVRYTKYYLR